MKKNIYFLLAIAFFSCSQFSLMDVNRLRKNMTSEKVRKIVHKGPQKEFFISIKSDEKTKYLAQVFEIDLGSYSALYLAVYSDDKLLYWGYPYEFNRHPDPLLNEIGKTAVAEYEKIK